MPIEDGHISLVCDSCGSRNELWALPASDGYQPYLFIAFWASVDWRIEVEGNGRFIVLCPDCAWPCIYRGDD